MGRRGDWAFWAVLALLLGLWLPPAWSQEQPPELEAIYQRGLKLYEAGKHAEAIPIAEEYIAVAAAKFGEEHPHYATGLGYLALLYQLLDRPSDAEPLFKRAVSIKGKILGPDHTQVADALHDVAEFYRKQGRFSEAEPLYQRVLSVAEKAMGREHASTGIVLGNLAELYRAQGRHAEAEPLAKRSVAIREKASAEAEPNGRSRADEQPVDLLSFTDRLQQLHEAGNYPEGLRIAEQYVVAARKRHGEEHPDYVTAISWFAVLLRDANRFSEAEPWLRRALAITEKAGSDNPFVANALSNLALLLQDTNRLAEAEPLIRRAVAIDEKSLGPEHSKVAVRLGNLASLLMSTGRFAEAVPYSAARSPSAKKPKVPTIQV